MESRRRHKWDNYRRSQSKRPPRGTCSWQPAVPSWEKEFCRVVGSLNWETLLQKKKFMHIYENVIKWNDSAGEEAFSNAKKRFWAEINGLPSDIPLPDPDLYIDKIDWDSEIDSELLSDLDSEPIISNADKDHDPVIIFSDSLLASHGYSLAGWGDDEENFKVPPNSSSANHGDPWEQNWGDSFDHGAAIGWPGYSNNASHFDNGYMMWRGGWNNDGGWNYTDNNMVYEGGPDIEHKIADGEQGPWNDNNVAGVNTGGYISGGRASRVKGNDHYRNYISRYDEGRHKETYWVQQSATGNRSDSREWNLFNSFGTASHHAAITVGQTWNQ